MGKQRVKIEFSENLRNNFGAGIYDIPGTV